MVSTPASSVRRQESHLHRQDSQPGNAHAHLHPYRNEHANGMLAVTLTAAGRVVKHATGAAVSQGLSASRLIAAGVNNTSYAMPNDPDVHANLHDVVQPIQPYESDDVFPASEQKLTWHLVEESAPQTEWIVLFSTIIVLCCIDRFVLQIGNNKGNLRYVLQFAFWIFAGLAYGVHYSMHYGRAGGVDWFYGYALEWALSLDNLFVLHLVVTSFQVPAELQHRALFFAIAGAMLIRLALFVVLGTLVHLLDPVRVIFGLVLIWSGISTLRDDEDDDINPDDFAAVRFFKFVFGTRILTTYDPAGRSIFMRDGDGRLCATLLVPVILSIEVVDVFFAVDSISAKVAQIHNIYIIFSSTVMAMFGLRACYFIVQNMVEYFALLKYGICFILVFIGIELLASPWIELPSSALLTVILAVFCTSVLASVTKEASRQRQPQPAGEEHVSAGEAAADDAAVDPAPSPAANPQSDEAIGEAADARASAAKDGTNGL